MMISILVLGFVCGCLVRFVVGVWRWGLESPEFVPSVTREQRLPPSNPPIHETASRGYNPPPAGARVPRDSPPPLSGIVEGREKRGGIGAKPTTERPEFVPPSAREALPDGAMLTSNGWMLPGERIIDLPNADIGKD